MLPLVIGFGQIESELFDQIIIHQQLFFQAAKFDTHKSVRFRLLQNLRFPASFARDTKILNRQTCFVHNYFW